MEGVDRINKWKECMEGEYGSNERTECKGEVEKVMNGRSVWKEWIELMNGRSG